MQWNDIDSSFRKLHISNIYMHRKASTQCMLSFFISKGHSLRLSVEQGVLPARTRRTMSNKWSHSSLSKARPRPHSYQGIVARFPSSSSSFSSPSLGRSQAYPASSVWNQIVASLPEMIEHAFRHRY